ncbi:MAG: glycosyltransferase [Treponema sp.]|nr:glycosyltransferase [Treponema sp.]MCL2271829.1 glycosyltransferase [Treponema sp.]
MKKIMIISSTKTGHGHQSIAVSLTEQLNQFNNIQVDVINGFSLFGRLAVKASGIYGIITRYGEQLWKLNYETAANKSEPLVQMMAKLIHDRFMQRIKNNTPNLIISVHPMFNACITSIMIEHDIKIPFITLLADLVDIHPMWVDTNADYILCPTEESLNACIALGASHSKLLRFGFPVRQRFIDAAKQIDRQPYSSEKPLECLIMSGGEGSGNLKLTAELLLNNLDCKVTIICGWNMRMKTALEKQLARYDNRVNILGFCKNVQDYMIKADLAILRGSPNSIMEAVICNTPLIITEALPGQEASNPEYMEKERLGVKCENINQIHKLIQSLLENNSAGLNNIAMEQKVYRDFSVAYKIAQFLVEHALDVPPFIQKTEYKFPLFMQAVELYRKMETEIKSRLN